MPNPTKTSPRTKTAPRTSHASQTPKTSQVLKSEQSPFFLKLTLILAKSAEIVHWLLVAVMALAALISVTNPQGLDRLIMNTTDDAIISCYGFSADILQHPTPDDVIINHAAITFFCFGSIAVLSLMAMIFRNVYLILKTSTGRTWFARGNTPFQQNIVRMTREIGIFFISISALSLLSVIVVSLSSESIVALNYESAFIGLVFLCFSTFFSYGAKLQEDIDGLI